MGDAEGPTNNASGEALESANHAKKPLKTTTFKHPRELGLLESGYVEASRVTFIITPVLIPLVLPN